MAKIIYPDLLFNAEFDIDKFLRYSKEKII